MNPLDWSGPSFLGLFIPLVAASFVLAEFAWHLLHLPSDEPDAADRKRYPLELVYLSEGAAGVVQGAVVGMVQQGNIVWDQAAGKLKTVTRPTPSTFEHKLWSLLQSKGGSGCEPHTLVAEGAPLASVLATPLEAHGLLVADGQKWVIRWLLFLLLTPIVVLGGLKIYVGVLREKPILFLGIAEFLAVCILIFYLGREIHRSLKGYALLNDLRSRSAALRTTAGSTETHILATNDLLLAIALFGLTTLQVGPFQSLHSAFLPKSAGGSGCGSGCGSSGGCGGGGCGGGGCGGCGG